MIDPWHPIPDPQEIHPAAFESLRHDPTGAVLILFGFADLDDPINDWEWLWQLRTAEWRSELMACPVSLPEMSALAADLEHGRR